MHAGFGKRAMQLIVPTLGLAVLWPYFRASLLLFLSFYTDHGATAVQAAHTGFALSFLACTLLVLTAPRVKERLRASRFLALMGLCGVLGNLVLWLPLAGPLSTVACALGGAAGCAFFIGTLLRYAVEFARQDPVEVAVVCFASFGLSFLDNVAFLLPFAGAAAYCVASPLISVFGAHWMAGSAGPTDPQPCVQAQQNDPRLGTAALLMVLLALFCFAGNFIRGVTDPWFSYTGPSASTVLMSSLNIVIVVASIAFLVKKTPVTKVLFWNWVLDVLLFFAGIIAVTFFDGPLAELGSDVATVSRVCFSLLIFLFALEARQRVVLGPARLVGVFLLVPESVSAAVRHIAIPIFLQGTSIAQSTIASYAGVAILFALVVAMTALLANLLLGQDRRGLDANATQPCAHEQDPGLSGTPAPAPNATPAAAGPTLEERAKQHVAQTYGLTAREAQTAWYVSRGYSLEKTAELLGISINTVRTHMRSVYSKLQIHSRQELIDLLDQAKATLS